MRLLCHLLGHRDIRITGHPIPFSPLVVGHWCRRCRRTEWSL